MCLYLLCSFFLKLGVRMCVHFKLGDTVHSKECGVIHFVLTLLTIIAMIRYKVFDD